MGDSDGEPSAVTELLKLVLPGTARGRIAPAGVSQNEQVFGIVIALPSFAEPPTADGGGFVRDAHEQSAAIGLGVVDAIENGHALGLRPKIVVVDRGRRAIPLAAWVLEVPYQFYVRNTNRNWLTLLARSDEKVEEAGCCIARRRANL